MKPAACYASKLLWHQQFLLSLDNTTAHIDSSPIHSEVLRLMPTIPLAAEKTTVNLD